MKNKELKGILALLVVTALSFGVIIGAKNLSGNMTEGTSDNSSAALTEEFDTTEFEKIDKAGKTADGYLVTVREKGYGGDIVMNVFFDKSGNEITKAEVIELAETPDIGARIAEPEFLEQFQGIKAPVYFDGFQLTPSAPPALSVTKTLTDGTYEAKTDAPDANGFTDVVTLTVENGQITAVNWDAVTADGAKKSVMSENGEYTMTEDGLTWKAQAEALAAALVENQSLAFLTTNEQGKTDAVSGVSISVGGFMNLAHDCLKQASAIKTPVLTDGTYEAKTDSPDNSGFTDVVTLTVENGQITAVSWDAVNADGAKKSVLSENGEYTMTEDGLTWKAQAEALAAALVENQSLSFLTTNEQGKTDAVSGVSISVGGFINLAQDCLEQAAGIEAEEPEAPAEGTKIDAVSGATISSTAAVKAINNAYEFLQTVK